MYFHYDYKGYFKHYKHCFRHQFLVLAVFLFSSSLSAQKKIVDDSKTAPGLAYQISLTNNQYLIVEVKTTSVPILLKWMAAQNNLKVKSIDEYWQVITVETNKKGIQLLQSHPFVTYLQNGNRKAFTELSVPGYEPAAGSAALASARFPQSTGQGISISLKEENFDTTDIDLRKRFFVTSFTSKKNSTNHATIMASMMAGSGNSSSTGKGIAHKALLTSTSFENLLPEPNSFYTTNRISVQNHSYGVGIENEYGIDGAAYDASTWQLPQLLHVFSAGNAGNNAAASGIYKNLAGWANLTGSFKMSKNSLSVEAIDSFNRPEVLGSNGPAYDGRLKPELAAFGEDGTSGAAALVSGTAALLQQQLLQQTGQLPPASLVKALLINGSDDTGPEGPDFMTGYGLLNIYQTFNIAANKNLYQRNCLIIKFAKNYYTNTA